MTDNNFEIPETLQQQIDAAGQYHDPFFDNLEDQIAEDPTAQGILQGIFVRFAPPEAQIPPTMLLLPQTCGPQTIYERAPWEKSTLRPDPGAPKPPE